MYINQEESKTTTVTS